MSALLSMTSAERLERARIEAHVGHFAPVGNVGSPDERTIPSLLVGILDALIVIAENTTPPTTLPHDAAESEEP